MAEWIVPLSALLGVIGQLVISAKRRGADEQKLRSHDARILRLEEKTDDHGDRIATIEGRLESGRGTLRHG